PDPAAPAGRARRIAGAPLAGRGGGQPTPGPRRSGEGRDREAPPALRRAAQGAPPVLRPAPPGAQGRREMSEPGPGAGRGRWPGGSVAPGLAVSLILLLLQVRAYRFLTDDAFIAFRYAHHLATGRGLTFNPGSAPVEGFTSLSWVLILALLE